MRKNMIENIWGAGERRGSASGSEGLKRPEGELRDLETGISDETAASQGKICGTE